MTHVQTQTETIAWLCDNNVALNIPSYQRPYVWPAEDVKKLLSDIANASQDGQLRYYLGTIISARSQATSNPQAQRSYELIDGQQRSTTLILLALALRERLQGHPIAALPRLGDQPRLTFVIREEAQEFLAQAAGLPCNFPLDEKALASPYLSHLRQGLNAARQELQQLAAKGVDLPALASYLYNNVVWINSTIPTGMNPNRLFARTNTGGVQLEQSDILKAKLLHKIHDHKPRYDAIWQACENLNNFFERNVREIFPRSDWNHLDLDKLAQFDASLFPHHDEEAIGTEGKTLADLAEQPDTRSHETAADGQAAFIPATADNEEKTYCRSIISFPLLLMHTLRIFRAERKQEDIPSRLHAARFSAFFQDFGQMASEEEAIAFIECLWRVRFQLDRWVAKWRRRDGDADEHLYLENVSLREYKGSKRLTRESLEQTRDLVQLQTVRNFTGERSAQYWIGPFLARMMKQPKASFDTAQCVLEEIDNVLSLATATQKEACFALLCGENPQCYGMDWIEAHLQQALGTGFEHYWFQKLEYVLWKNRRNAQYLDEKRWQNFRISSKNSVEHVHPQQHEHPQAQLGPSLLNSFGNLVLLSPGENSSYSNQDPIKKRVDFESKPTYDSLKLAHIFHLMGKESWDGAKIGQHQQEMLKLLREHHHKQAGDGNPVPHPPWPQSNHA